MPEYRTNSLLTVFPDYDVDEPGFTVELLDEQRKFRLPDVELLSLLSVADDWTDRERLVAHAEDRLGLPADEAESLVDQFVEFEFLLPRNSDGADLEARAEPWRAADWHEALHFHLYIRDLEFLPEMIGETDTRSVLQADNEVMAEYAESDPVPPNYKEYDDAATVPLPAVDTDRDVADFADAIGTPTGSSRPDADLDREALSELLFYPFGETGTSDFGDPQGTKLLKTVPSGGARHPVEAYLAVLDVDDVPDGLYHYSVKEHALDAVERGRDAAEAVADAVHDDPEFAPSLVVFYGAVLARSMWRYREPRTYRVIFHDVGHVVETLDLLAVAHDRPTRFGIDFDERASTLLGLDRYDEPLLGYSAVG